MRIPSQRRKDRCTSVLLSLFASLAACSPDAAQTKGTDAGGGDGGFDAASTSGDSGTPDGATPSCDTTLQPGANIAVAVASAAAGSTICLSAGSYPAFTLTGVSKDPRVSVVALSNLAATSSFTIDGDSNGITLDGLTLSSGLITGANTKNVTVRNSAFTGQLRIDGITTPAPNLLFDHNTHNNIDVQTAPNARLHFSYSGVSTGAPVATVQNSIFDGSCSDGIQTGVPIVVRRNQFRNLLVGACPNDPHTDAVQFYGGPFAGTVVRENYFVNNEQVLTAFDGVDHLLIEGNVFDPGASAPRPCQIELYADIGSTIRHNTLLDRGNNGRICLDHKAADPAGSGTIIDNNIASALDFGNGSTAATNTNNLLAMGGGGGNLSGSPTYVGGALPATWAGLSLTAGSLGKGVGTNPAGSDIGASYFGP